MAHQFREADKGEVVEGGRCGHDHCIASNDNGWEDVKQVLLEIYVN